MNKTKTLKVLVKQGGTALTCEGPCTILFRRMNWTRFFFTKIMDKPRIVWMVDESIANAKPQDWGKVSRLEQELVDLIGNPAFNHQVVHPLTCLKNLAGKIKDGKFSCVLDLAGWLAPVFREIFPESEVFSGFSMSRIRKVSSATLETTGYILTISPEEIRSVASRLDLSHPLIVDDVSFSGWTSRKTMELWGLDPKETTHAFLIANTGELGPKPGAVKALESMGCKVFWGENLATPNEDGWHLKDLHTHPKIGSAFDISLILHYAFSEEGINSSMARSIFENRQSVETLFPGCLNSVVLKELEKKGKFIALNENTLTDDAIHAKNPFLWASPYFQEHVDRSKIVFHRVEILSILKELKLLTSDPEAKLEASLELQKEVHNLGGPKGERLS